MSKCERFRNVANESRKWIPAFSGMTSVERLPWGNGGWVPMWPATERADLEPLDGFPISKPRSGGVPGY